MSLARLKRLQRLEARQPRGTPWVDPFDAAMALFTEFEAVAAGNACFIPVYGPPEAPTAAFELRMREADSTAARLTAAPKP